MDSSSMVVGMTVVRQSVGQVVRQSVRQSAAALLATAVGWGLAGSVGAQPAAAHATAHATAHTTAHTTAQMVQVQVPSQDAPDGQPLQLSGYWFATQADAPRPAVLLLHGCGGVLGASGQLSQRLREYTRLLQAEGWAVLVLDAFSPRGEREICTQRIGQRKITMSNRRLDVLGALAWLAAQPGVDAQRLALLGWSHGGSTVLAATNLRHPAVAAAAAAALRPRAAVAFYPGCAADLQQGHAASAPLLLLLGADDDWTPAAPCLALVDAAVAGAAGADIPKPQVVVYPGAYHGFDGTAPVQLRRDVPNGARPGAGVHVGGQPEARVAAHAQLLGFLRQALR